MPRKRVTTLNDPAENSAGVLQPVDGEIVDPSAEEAPPVVDDPPPPSSVPSKPGEVPLDYDRVIALDKSGKPLLKDGTHIVLREDYIAPTITGADMVGISAQSTAIGRMMRLAALGRTQPDVQWLLDEVARLTAAASRPQSAP